MIIRKSQAEIELMGAAGEVVAATLALLGENIRAGVTTAELDALAEEFILSQGGEPTFKGYRGYPGRHVPVAERHDRPRHPGRLHARGG